MQANRPMQAQWSVSSPFKWEAVMLLAAVFTIVWLRLALPALNFGFGQPMPHMRVGADTMTSMPQQMDDSASLTYSHSPTDQHCRETMPGCNAYLQGLCSFVPIFVATRCESLALPLLVQVTPPITSADDLSPPVSAPRFPP